MSLSAAAFSLFSPPGRMWPAGSDEGDAKPKGASCVQDYLSDEGRTHRHQLSFTASIVTLVDVLAT